MDTEYFIVDQSSNWETIEALNKFFPQFKTIPSFALIVKSINSINTSAFMVSSQQEKVFRVLNFISEHQTNNLKVLLTSVNIVSKEEIIAFWWESSNFKYSKQIDELTMDITRNNQRSIKFHHHWLTNENLLRLLDQHFYLLFKKVHWFNSKFRLVVTDVLSHF